MPICPLNVFYKLFTKVLTTRLMEVAEDIISENQATFIRGRNILEGVLMLHVIIHEMQAMQLSGTTILKLDFENAYDRVH
jgi:hypothetical protein